MKTKDIIRIDNITDFVNQNNKEFFMYQAIHGLEGYDPNYLIDTNEFLTKNLVKNIIINIEKFCIGYQRALTGTNFVFSCGANIDPDKGKLKKLRTKFYPEIARDITSRIKPDLETTLADEIAREIVVRESVRVKEKYGSYEQPKKVRLNFFYCPVIKINVLDPKQFELRRELFADYIVETELKTKDFF